MLQNHGLLQPGTACQCASCDHNPLSGSNFSRGQKMMRSAITLEVCLRCDVCFWRILAEVGTFSECLPLALLPNQPQERRPPENLTRPAQNPQPTSRSSQGALELPRFLRMLRGSGGKAKKSRLNPLRLKPKFIVQRLHGESALSCLALWAWHQLGCCLRMGRDWYRLASNQPCNRT